MNERLPAIWFYGAKNGAEAHMILRHGLPPHSSLCMYLEDALTYGMHVFEVEADYPPSSRVISTQDWIFRGQIVSYSIYNVNVVVDHPDRRSAVLQKNLSAAKVVDNQWVTNP